MRRIVCGSSSVPLTLPDPSNGGGEHPKLTRTSNRKFRIPEPAKTRKQMIHIPTWRSSSPRGDFGDESPAKILSASSPSQRRKTVISNQKSSQNLFRLRLVAKPVDRRCRRKRFSTYFSTPPSLFRFRLDHGLFAQSRYKTGFGMTSSNQKDLAVTEADPIDLER